MNTYNKLFIIFASFCILMSCKDEDSTLEVSTVQLEFPYVGGAQTINIISNGDWSLYGMPEWLMASRYSGINTQDVSLTVAENSTGLDREAVLTVRTNNNEKVRKIKVVQMAYPSGSLFEVDNTDTKYFDGDGDASIYADSIIIKSSGRWRITGPDWLNMNYNHVSSPMNRVLREGSGTIYLYALKDNSSKDAQVGNINICSEAGDKVINIPVVQMGIMDVKSVNMHVLTDCMWCNFRYGYGIQYIGIKIHEGIVSEEQVTDKMDGRMPISYILTPPSDLKPDTDYSLCTRGMISETTFYRKTNIEVFHTPSDINQPRANIEEVKKRSDGKWHFKVVQNQFAKGYYCSIFNGNEKGKAYYASSSFSTFSSVDKAEKFFRAEDQYFTTSDGNKTIVAWAIGEDGQLSKTMEIYKISASNNAPISLIKTNCNMRFGGAMDLKDLSIEIPMCVK